MKSDSSNDFLRSDKRTTENNCLSPDRAIIF